jgi:hypothetical protein
MSADLAAVSNCGGDVGMRARESLASNGGGAGNGSSDNSEGGPDKGYLSEPEHGNIGDEVASRGDEVALALVRS